MEFAEIKKAVMDYATEVETASNKVKTSFTAIMNAQNDMVALEDKWANGADTLESSINAIPLDSVKASYVEQYALLKAQREGLIAMLAALDTAVTDAGLMLI